MKQLLAEMKAIDFGYPLGDNVVASPQDPVIVKERLATIGGDAVDAFQSFYAYCDGPDVRNGYFIKSIAKLGVSRPDSDPKEVIGEYAGAVLAFGSMGNGGLFVVRRIEVRCAVSPARAIARWRLRWPTNASETTCDRFLVVF